jgi:hypothetical protein
MPYKAPRSDSFFYIEIIDKQVVRDCKINDVLGDTSNTPHIRYLNGSQTTLQIAHYLHTALFWKNRFSAEHRVELLDKYKQVFQMEIKELKREDFIKAIPDTVELKGYALFYWQKNRDLKLKELAYEK